MSNSVECVSAALAREVRGDIILGGINGLTPYFLDTHSSKSFAFDAYKL